MGHHVQNLLGISERVHHRRRHAPAARSEHGDGYPHPVPLPGGEG
ncbi:hypothetical protein [Archangium violaceum]